MIVSGRKCRTASQIARKPSWRIAHDALGSQPGGILPAVVAQRIEMRDRDEGRRQPGKRRRLQRLGDLVVARRLQDRAIIGDIRRGQAGRRSHFDIGTRGKIAAERRVDQHLADDA